MITIRSRKKQQKTHLDTKSSRIILYSNFAINNPDDKIVKHLLVNKIMTKKDAEQLKISGEELGALIKLCQSEWIILADKTRLKNESDPKNIKCDLCDQPNLENLFYVKNVETNVEMCIGSTCVEEYGVKTKQAKTNLKIYQAEILLAKHLPDLNDFLINNRSIPNKYFLVSSVYLDKWSNQIEKLKLLKEKLQLNPSQIILKELIKEWDSTLLLINDIEKYLASINHLDLFPNENIIQWIIKNDESEHLRKYIRSNKGLIGKAIFSRIWENDYLHKHLLKIQKSNEWIKILQLKRNSLNIRFKLTELRAFETVLVLNVQEFLEAFTEFIFQEDYSSREIEDYLISESKLDKDVGLYVKVFLYFDNQIKSLGYTIIDDVQNSTDLIIFKKGLYYLIDGEKFSNSVKVYYLNQDKYNSNLEQILSDTINKSTIEIFDEEKWTIKKQLGKYQNELIRNQITK